MTGDTFVLELPPRPEHLGTARTFASQIARHAGCDDDAVEDVKLAVSEACAGSVSDAADAEPVWVRSTLEPGHITFEVEGSGDLRSRSVDEALARLDLVRTLFPDVSLTPRDQGRTSVRFTVSLEA